MALKLMALACVAVIVFIAVLVCPYIMQLLVVFVVLLRLLFWVRLPHMLKLPLPNRVLLNPQNRRSGQGTVTNGGGKEVAEAFHVLWGHGSRSASMRFIVEGDIATTSARIYLVKVVALVISLGLSIFSITPMEEMR